MLHHKHILLITTFFLYSSHSYAEPGIPTNHLERHSSYPYISGDTFRAICNHHIDETGRPFNPYAVNKGDIIFVRGYPQFLDVFLKHLPNIKNNFILLTHNNDETMPGKYAFLLEDSRLIAWFTQNKGPINHPKLNALPIGLANAYWSHGNTTVLTDALKTTRNIQKKYFFYVNFNKHTNLKARNTVANQFSSKSFSTNASPKPWSEYLKDLASSRFVLSPPGNGMDCHRAWEALLMGSIPVMQSTSIDCLFEDLPVVIVKDWNEVTKDFLDKKYLEISNKTYNLNKLYADYWLDKIKIAQAYAKSKT